MEDFGRSLGGAGVAAMLPQAFNPTVSPSSGNLPEIQNLVNLQQLHNLLRAQQLLQRSNHVANPCNLASQAHRCFPNVSQTIPAMNLLVPPANCGRSSSLNLHTLKIASAQSIPQIHFPGLARIASSVPSQHMSSTSITPALPSSTAPSLHTVSTSIFDAFGEKTPSSFSPDTAPMFTKRKLAADNEGILPCKSRKVEFGDSPSTSGTTSPSNTGAKPVKTCEHGRRAGQCKDCRGSNVCDHGRRRSRCKDCGGSAICVHNRQRNYCKDCGGSGICVHSRKRSLCKECGGSSICQHQRQRSRCKECGGSQICGHGRRRSLCKECGGSQICLHQRQRSLCKDCGGSQICIHKRRKRQCKECAQALALKTAAATVAAGHPAEDK